MTEQRQSRRAEAHLEASIEPAAGESMPIKARTLNIGEGGVYVEVPDFIKPLTQLWITLDLPGPSRYERLETEVIVLRSQPAQGELGVPCYQIACAFIELSDSQRQALRRFVRGRRGLATLSILVDAAVDTGVVAQLLGDLAIVYEELSGGDELLIRGGYAPAWSGMPLGR